MKRILACAMAVILVSQPASGDEFTDTIGAALEAYAAGDIKGAGDELDYAQDLLRALGAKGLEAFLPAAQAGWTRTISQDSAEAGMAMLGGASATAEYAGPEGEFTVTLATDSPMMQAFMPMFSNAMILNAMGKVIRIQREKFVIQDDSNIIGIVDDRVLVTAEGTPVAAMQAHLEAMDLTALAAY